MYSKILVLVQFITIFSLLFSTSVFPTNVFSLLFIGGGILLGVYAFLTLRKTEFLIVPDVAKKAILITQGPYKVIRHPMYASVLMIGVGILIGNITFFRVFVYILLVIDLVFKLQYEEKLLQRRFKEYEEYKKNTYRLIPLIY